MGILSEEERVALNAISDCGCLPLDEDYATLARSMLKLADWIDRQEEAAVGVLCWPGHSAIHNCSATANEANGISAEELACRLPKKGQDKEPQP